MAGLEDDEYIVPLTDQRVFGAGLKRKRVQFIPSTDSTLSSVPSGATPLKPSSSVQDTYLSIVLPKTATSSTPSSTEPAPPAPPLCEICNLPLPIRDGTPTPADGEKPHEASLAHQVCITHSHPPSHIDRNRKGLAYLEAYGWDPDSRLGLGAQGEGRREPIKVKVKNDTVGLGVKAKGPSKAVGKDGTFVDERGKIMVVKNGRVVEKAEKLGAKKIRKLDELGRKRRERLREQFYRSEDLEKYLGTGSAV